MASYTTIDFLPDLTSEEMNSSQQLTFEKYTPVIPDPTGLITWDNVATYYTSENYALLKANFILDLKEGATYDLFSSSYFDPFILLLYDNIGNVVAIDTGDGSDGQDIIFSYVAPYTGKYYANASWNQGLADSHKSVSFSVYEDVGTTTTLPPPPPLLPRL